MKTNESCLNSQFGIVSDRFEWQNSIPIIETQKWWCWLLEDQAWSTNTDQYNQQWSKSYAIVPNDLTHKLHVPEWWENNRSWSKSIAYYDFAPNIYEKYCICSFEQPNSIGFSKNKTWGEASLLLRSLWKWTDQFVWPPLLNQSLKKSFMIKETGNKSKIWDLSISFSNEEVESDECAPDFAIIDPKFRKDVIFKRIVRSCKRYYSKKFQKFVGKSRQTFAKIKVNKKRITRYAKEFIASEFGEDASKEMELFLFMFLDKSETKYKNLSTNKTIKEELFSMLYSFNTQKLLKLLKCKGFAKMMLHYLSIPKISSIILKSSGELDMLENYDEYIQKIQHVCLQNLSESG